ncbi:MAG TPA: type I phosphomannose isomerase catalytic subunit [Prolixibacteraceae bacterium]|nr:type I phosphomannose isomerase catalytic subunit [Prolixibacteraceae bacterium]
MKNLYPLKFRPIYKERIWGGDKLPELLNKNYAIAHCGESWELSGVQQDISVVSDGFLKGNNLEELIEVYMGELVGEKIYDQFGTEFPLLIKYIDANDRLSIQVHPDDELSKERHGAYGKTEMWYVVQADEGAELISGFNRDIDRDSYLIALQNDKLENLLQFDPVKKGDVFFIPAGRVHAIGKGIVVAEIQQTSDVTYRIFDFNRVDDKGQPRELHTELALDAINFKHHKTAKSTYQPKLNDAVELVKCDYFTTKLLQLTAELERDFSKIDSFVIYLCLEGSYTLQWESESVRVQKGETLLVPAAIEHFFLKPNDNQETKLLEVYID